MHLNEYVNPFVFVSSVFTFRFCYCPYKPKQDIAGGLGSHDVLVASEQLVSEYNTTDDEPYSVTFIIIILP